MKVKELIDKLSANESIQELEVFTDRLDAFYGPINDKAPYEVVEMALSDYKYGEEDLYERLDYSCVIDPKNKLVVVFE